jgi:hypothetical protein
MLPARDIGESVVITVATSGPSWTDKATVLILGGQLLLLLVAAVFAWWQLGAQFRPFVVIDFAIPRSNIIQLEITNIGSTLARDVRFTFDPPLETTFDNTGTGGGTRLADRKLFKEGIPTLAPGKTLHALFDQGSARTQAGLPDLYKATVSYRGDPFRRKFKEDTEIDLGVYRVGRVNLKDLQDVHGELEKIRKAVESWGHSASGIKITTRDEEWKLFQLHNLQIRARTAGRLTRPFWHCVFWIRNRMG